MCKASYDINEPVVAASPALKLLGAERVGDVLDGVAEAVSVVVGGVDAPFVAGPVVSRVLDAVGYRILLALLQGDLHPQRGLALLELTVLHILEKLKNNFKTKLN